MNFKTAETLKDSIWQIYREGLTTASGGNISSKDEEGNIWISPSQIDKGFLQINDFACINLDGDLRNSNKPSMEFPFHLAIYKNDPEVNAVCHLHSPVLVALSLLIPDQKLIDILSKFECGYAEYAIPGSEELGQNICKAFEKNPRLVIMQNHGVIATGKSIGEAADKIRKLSKQVQEYFKIEDALFNSISSEIFDLGREESIEFYKNRASHFLSLNGGIDIIEKHPGDPFQANFKLHSLQKLQKLNLEFSCNIIPESYLLLNEMILIKEVGQVTIEGHSLFNVYDRMEVLDFTAKVILLAHRMGSINLLKDAQIQELEKKFFV